MYNLLGRPTNHARPHAVQALVTHRACHFFFRGCFYAGGDVGVKAARVVDMSAFQDDRADVAHEVGILQADAAGAFRRSAFGGRIRAHVHCAAN